MARVFITGSSDGLGLMAGRLLAGQGHEVVLQARNSGRPAATGTGGYFFHQQPQQVHPAARDVTVQDELLAYCAGLSGTELPA